MHKQPLGSPSSKLHHGGIILMKDDTSSSTSPSNEALSQGGRLVEEEKLKKLKPKPKTTTEIYIHFIPMLTLLCLLVLYLSSHNPSQIEFNGYKHLSDSGDSRKDVQKSYQIVKIKQGGTLAVTWKNRRFLRRKMSDF